MPKQKKTLTPLEGDHAQALTSPAPAQFSMAGRSSTQLYSPGLGDAEGLANLVLTDLATTFKLNPPQQACNLAFSPILKFPIFDNLVGERELDPKVAATLNLNYDAGEAIHLPMVGDHVPVQPESIREGTTSIPSIDKVDRAPMRNQYSS